MALKRGDRVLVKGEPAYYAIVHRPEVKSAREVQSGENGKKRLVTILRVQVHFEFDGHEGMVLLDDLEKTDYNDHGRGIERPEWRP